MWNRRIPFKVDIAGIIEIMGSSLYSRLDTPIRELIQNSHDAIMRRRSRDLSFQGRIDIVQDAENGTITFTDDGIGLSAEEAESYLGTLGIGITGLLKGRGSEEARQSVSGSGDELIGQFGIGLFSAFMLADQLVVESRKSDDVEPVRWVAGAGTEIELSPCERDKNGTSVCLHLKKDYVSFAIDPEMLELAVKRYADFLPVPIFLNGSSQRINVIQASWFESGHDEETIELDLASYFEETPLDVIPIKVEKPVVIEGALYISPQRTPGFTDDSVVAATIRRMVISRHVQDLLPSWGSFLRGILELPDCSPTASREDLVRDGQFARTKATLAKIIYDHLNELAEKQPARLEAIISWHRFTIAGSALDEEPLRQLLRSCYRFSTTQGDLTFEQILERCEADPLYESEADQVIWYNADRRQERYLSDVFDGTETLCVHALRSFEELLLASMVADTQESVVDVRVASPSSPGFDQCVLGMSDMEDASAEWSEFLSGTGAKVLWASYRQNQPVMAFLNERYELAKTFEDLKKEGEIPRGFQRMIDAHFENSPADQNEVILNREHRLVKRALERGTRSPLANVVRLLVSNALHAAGAASDRKTQQMQSEDLDWIAEVLWGRDT
ncbi:ATP-binding protein [Stieleria varia]|uniref:Chaperone protein HtpG n=1 Tax=Stieleria varia TaxID=2528005 RepID=A0A5C6A0E4_9BACT|nr:ATP-binding protein [Stieleria varia]TWT93294.1 Chaperone protein HtpG [Stieleria varia]